MVHIDRKQYWVIFVVLSVLTALEVGVVYVPGIAKSSLVAVLILLAVVKAAIVALFYMHLNHDTSIMKWSIALPLSMPAIYAVVLIGDAAWRMLPL
jgi:cytochrome c oxidase subunit 4